MNKEYMTAFRESRKAMGFRHTSAYVPSNRLAEFSLYVERLKAERMLEICQLPPHGRERRALSTRNTPDVPSEAEIKAVLERHPHQPALQKTASTLFEHLAQANTASNVAKLEDDEDMQIKYMSLNVAHTHMASVLWRELVFMLTQLEGNNARV